MTENDKTRIKGNAACGAVAALAVKLLGGSLLAATGAGAVIAVGLTMFGMKIDRVKKERV
jgi:hypothetical protein